MPVVNDSVVVREATTGDELGVRRVLDAAMLESTATSDAIARGDAFVAVAGGDGAVGDDGVDDEGCVVGALVLVPHSMVDLPNAVAEQPAAVDSSRDAGAGDVGIHVDAVAVRRRRRGRGIGRALVEVALDRERRLTVAFDPDVRAFYDALAFAVVVESEETSDGRAWAVRETKASLDG